MKKALGLLSMTGLLMAVATVNAPAEASVTIDSNWVSCNGTCGTYGCPSWSCTDPGVAQVAGVQLDGCGSFFGYGLTETDMNSSHGSWATGSGWYYNAWALCSDWTAPESSNTTGVPSSAYGVCKYGVSAVYTAVTITC